MTVYQEISAAITLGKTTAMSWADGYIVKVALGDKLGCCELQLVVLTEWLDMLENYLDTAFDADGNAITPDLVCLTEAQALLLVGKITAASSC